MRSGIRSESVPTQRNFLADGNVKRVISGVTLDKDQFAFEDAQKECHIPYGAVLGKITASGLYRLCTRGKLESGASATDTTIELSDRRNFSDDIQPIPFVAGDSIVIGTGGTAETKTIDSIDYDTCIVTLTTQLAHDHSADEVVKCADGSQDAECILAEPADVTDNNFVASAFREAYVIEDRMPYDLDDDEKTRLLANSLIRFWV